MAELSIFRPTTKRASILEETLPTRSHLGSIEYNLRACKVYHKYRYKSNEAYYTFVALDPNRKPKPVPQLIPETEEEQKLFDGALRRRQLRLILGGKMKPNDAAELKALFAEG